MEKEDWRGKAYAFYTNKACEAFPCHQTTSEADFNCLFCFCPLYLLGGKCGGDFIYLPNGVKDCSGCALPHQRENYGMITGRFNELTEIIRQKNRENGGNAQ